MFLRVQHNLSDSTVNKHIAYASTFFKSGLSINDFLFNIKRTKSSSTYANYLKTLRILFRDYLKQPASIQDFKFPKKQYKPKILPSKFDLILFYNALPNKYKIIFLALVSSGLRISELLNAKMDKNNRMLMPQSHEGNTKNSWLSFYNSECEDLMKQYSGNPFDVKPNIIARTFRTASAKTNIIMTPHTLRSIFAREMSKAGVQDRYIDAFCGRTPQSVLARHYSDYSPEVLKEIYNKANIKILS